MLLMTQLKLSLTYILQNPSLQHFQLPKVRSAVRALRQAQQEAMMLRMRNAKELCETHRTPAIAKLELTTGCRLTPLQYLPHPDPWIAFVTDLYFMFSFQNVYIFASHI